LARKGEAVIGCPAGLPPKTTELPPVPQTASPLAPRASPIAQEASSLTPENDERLLEIAKPARDKKKLIPSLTRTIIRRLCSERFLTAEQLGNLMERRKDKLQENFLAPMVAAGELCLRFPDQTTHPEQACRTQPDWREEFLVTCWANPGANRSPQGIRDRVFSKMVQDGRLKPVMKMS
jgi:hypothetical protein